MFRIFDCKFSILGIAVVFEIQRVAFQAAAPADDNRAFLAQVLQHLNRIEVQNRGEQEFYVIDHDNAGVEAVNRRRNEGNSFFRTVGPRNFQEFVVEELAGFANLPAILERQFTDELALARAGTADKDKQLFIFLSNVLPPF